jgi:hypothetical protein
MRPPAQFLTTYLQAEQPSCLLTSVHTAHYKLCTQRVAGSDMGEGGAFELVLPAVTGIVRRGVGLNTKVRFNNDNLS